MLTDNLMSNDGNLANVEDDKLLLSDEDLLL